MQVATLNIPAIYLDTIAKLVSIGMFQNRSEAIRHMVRGFLKRELNMVEALIDLEGIEVKPAEIRKKSGPIDMRTIKGGWNK